MSEASNRPGKNRDRERHIIVAIGASAGGLEAINTFFDNLPEGTEHSYIIIQHLSSDHKSFLAELVAKHTAMNVVEAENNMKVKKQHVYVIPSRMMMTISDGQLNLLEKSTEHIPNNAIDIFLKSLADERGKDAIAVILSGTGSDGTRGADYIKASGGLVLVQDPLSARFDGMPNNAILSGNADAILEPEAMPSWLAKNIVDPAEPKEVAISEAQLQEIFGILRQNGGYDFHYYKTPTLIRRISKRIGMAGYDTTESYIAFLAEHKEEAIDLSKELFINVTSFFRDKAAFDLLYTEVIPELVRRRKEDGSIKIWVCACSTGEEAYSLALIFDKYIQEHRVQIDVKIFATDIDDQNILFAGRNSYPVAIEKNVPHDLLQRYFTLENNRYSVIPRIRKQIVFAKHNVIKDPAFIKNDLISCRNMLIYMNRILQEKIMATFHFSLNESGYLFLGTSESASVLKDGFRELSGKWKIYTRKDKKFPDILSRKLQPELRSQPSNPPGKTGGQERLTDELGRDFQSVLTGRMGYTALFIDAQYEIRETIGNYSQYLSLPQERLKLNLLNMLPEELSVVLENAIKRAWFGQKNVTLQHVPFPPARNRYLDIFIQPASATREKLTMIVMGASKGAHPGTETAPNPGSDDQSEYIRELEAQLTDSRDNLQLAIEGLETTNEELQSANEELLSSNEELQSSNEELQSLNEELHTLNTEHQAKIRELIELNDDLDNYLKSTDTGHVFLDAELCIRKFNPDAVKFINLIEGDIGRPVNHISNKLHYPQLQADVIKVQQSGKMLESEIGMLDGGFCIVRIYPYQRKDKVVDGLVLSFIDITDVKNLYGVVNGVFNSSLNAIIVLASEYDVQQEIVGFTISAVNYAAEALLGGRREDLQGLSFKRMAPHLLLHGIWDKLVKVARTGQSVTQEYYCETPKGERSYDISVVRINDGIMITYADITQKRSAEKRLKKNYNELIVTRESLKELNTRLEEEVAERTRELSMSEERFRLVSRATNDVIKDWDLVNNNIWNSESFLSLFQFKEEEVANNLEFWFEHIHPEDQNDVKQGIFKAINAGEPQWVGEYRFLNGKGAYCHVLERGYILKDEAGMPYRLISSLMDISALKKAEEATKELLQKKDEFMSIASHELKTPITSMKASLQIVERIIEEDDQKELAGEFIRKANDQVDKLTMLVENLLDVTKIQAGKMSFNKSEFEVSELVEECVYHIQNLSRNPIRIEANPGRKIVADQNRIEQVILNFLSNAVKYSPEATGVVLNSVIQNDVWELRVSDKGIGIAAENLPHVFDRFFRGIDSSEKFAGLGLGLYISADIIHRHGGDIGVESTLGQGSTFWFRLPFTQQTPID